MQILNKRLVWILLAAVTLSLTSYAYPQDSPAPAEDEGEWRDAAQPKPPAQEQETPAAEEGKETGEKEDEQQQEQQKSRGPFGSMHFLLIMIGGIVLLYIWMGRGKRRQETKRKEMLAALKKGDKVTSIGGIVGTIIEVREDEVVVKVDETNNVRMRFARWAVRGVGEQAKTESPSQQR